MDLNHWTRDAQSLLQTYVQPHVPAAYFQSADVFITAGSRAEPASIGVQGTLSPAGDFKRSAALEHQRLIRNLRLEAQLCYASPSSTTLFLGPHRHFLLVLSHAPSGGGDTAAPPWLRGPSSSLFFKSRFTAHNLCFCPVSPLRAASEALLLLCSFIQVFQQPFPQVTSAPAAAPAAPSAAPTTTSTSFHLRPSTRCDECRPIRPSTRS